MAAAVSLGASTAKRTEDPSVLKRTEEPSVPKRCTPSLEASRPTRDAAPAYAWMGTVAAGRGEGDTAVAGVTVAVVAATGTPGEDIKQADADTARVGGM
mmetsp:Transcript_50832/g.114277  ORF Transcript_50832/g.114277 Transcript_50832/m.114277 type:complete len:99 (-) Transcript_50832:99-395(-)